LKGKGAGGEGEKGGRKDTCALGARPGTQTKDGERCERKPAAQRDKIIVTKNRT
jgi:hypothetical protein